ncbi:putative membrane protein [Nocardioides ginsengisegetis]|uniref:Putative membrane protein n=1 Tax=Nocardioides ginsengisegetis TaxID=661491 RepID=A0A7W3IZD5_9ACTN|nr:hypothetical protein [Nocardioides ginsengisegetis]MBA8803468.1 putative membrane protein [Nocardioides ginsengisegetis]
MAHQNPLGRIKNLAVGAWKDPRSTAETVVAQARGTVALGRVVVGQVSTKIQERRGHATVPAPRAPTPEAPAEAEAPAAPPAEAVPNPARVAPRVAKQTPEQKALQQAATPRRAPVKKAAPGAKLPPRKPSAGE